ncbi:Tyrosine-tRNA ligase (tyrS) [Metamycoplasma alkalescens 14918]|uniref:Tyrosine--tRNA ligase n=1 Tax=Metamycoplasma alkalescens 14918 TaxID=1188234 RepID=N9SRI6_9BACT|nr:tyrosine--tRNA ligase [Metamycoplasma alkalescens]ENY54075.1 Tyrosine-tRNA ligase (tyrS) [Metamycoplasma alkalescens 14918]
MPKNFIAELKTRKILNNISNEKKFLEIPKNSGVYIGFDPTAKSLHLGNYLQIATLLRFKNAGYKVYAILGGITGMIGDPSFRNSERKFLDIETLKENKIAIKKQLKKFGLDVIDNLDFYKNIKLIDFFSKIGKLININYLLEKESITTRLKSGLTVTELCYQLIQGWDFKCMYEKHDVRIQAGGSDQWGNITTGLEFIRKIYGDSANAVALTINLLTDENGQKFGKSTGGGSLWLNKEMTTPYALYQFLLNQADEKIDEYLKILTFLSLDEINKIMTKHNQAKYLRFAQKTLAYHLVKDIHGARASNQAQKISNILFAKSNQNLTLSDIEMLKNSIQTIYVEKNQKFIDVIRRYKITVSNRETREFIQKKSFLIDNQIVVDENQIIEFKKYSKYALLKKGKKDFYILTNVEKINF